MNIKFWGTRGSIPVPDRNMMKYGGNTTCAEININNRVIVLDAGTGIIKLGKELTKRNITDIDLFITHSHWDHIHGFPFFQPAYNPKTKINIFGYTDSFEHFKTILTNQMSYEYFPVRFADLKSNISFFDTRAANFKSNAYKMSFIRANHPAFTMGIKIEEKGKSFVFITDNELFSQKAVTGRDEFVQFCYGADYLVHDAQFTENEYIKTKGWGHSTYDQVMALAKDSMVKNFGFIHHDPNRTDIELSAIEAKYQKLCSKSKCKFNVFAAKEGQKIIL